MWSIRGNLEVLAPIAGLTAMLGAIGEALGGRTGLVLALAIAAVGDLAVYLSSAGLPMPTVAAAPAGP